MITNTTIYDIIVSCPSDVQDEKEAINRVIGEINQYSIERHQMMFRVKNWLTDVDSDVGEPAQEHINKTLVDKCDILVGIFKTRLGTPTKVANSGAEEEIDRFVKQGKKCFLYFATTANINLTNLNVEQLTKLNEFRKKCESNSLYKTFDSIDALYDVFKSDFNLYITNNLINKEKSDELKVENETSLDNQEKIAIPKNDVVGENGVWDCFVEITQDLEGATSQLQDFTNKINIMNEDTSCFTQKINSFKKNHNIKPVQYQIEMKKYSEKLGAFADEIGNQYDSSKDVWKRIYKNAQGIFGFDKFTSSADIKAIAELAIVYETSLQPIVNFRNGFDTVIENLSSSKGYQKDINAAISKFEEKAVLYRDMLSDFIDNSKNILDSYRLKKEEV